MHRIWQWWLPRGSRSRQQRIELAIGFIVALAPLSVGFWEAARRGQGSPDLVGFGVPAVWALASGAVVWWEAVQRSDRPARTRALGIVAFGIAGAATVAVVLLAPHGTL